MPRIGSHHEIEPHESSYEAAPSSSSAASVRSPSPISIRSEPERSESPAPSSAHIDHSSIAAQYQGTDALSETPHNNAQAEQDFHTWNNNLSNHYASYLNNLPGNTDSGSAHFPLYRAAMEPPSEIFQERGELKSSTQLKKEAFDRMGRPLNPDETQHFSLARHQIGEGTAVLRKNVVAKLTPPLPAHIRDASRRGSVLRSRAK